MRHWIVSLTIALIATVASADSLVTSPGSGSWRTHSPGTAGFQFTVTGGFNLNVTALGFIDKDADGLATSHFVGLWNASGIKLAEVNVGGSTENQGTLQDGYRYLQLPTAIELVAGQTYTLGAQTTGTSDLFRDTGSTATFSADIGNLVARWTSEGSGGYTRPTNFGSGSGYMAPNLMYSVPEPGVIAPLALTGLLGLRRRRRAGRASC